MRLDSEKWNGKDKRPKRLPERQSTGLIQSYRIKPDSGRRLSCLTLLALALTVSILQSCGSRSSPAAPVIPYEDSRPWTRWWWFATEIQQDDIRAQLDWLDQHNFGGVEIAWVYPLYRFDRQVYGIEMEVDSSAAAWLSDGWTEAVAFAKYYADSIGLGCDFTFGTGWPFGASYVPQELGTKIYGDPDFKQTIHFGWEYPKRGRVIDHLDSNALKFYSEPLLQALRPALKGSASALFCDSWEIKLNGKHKLWTQGLDTRFANDFGYDILPFMDQGLDSFRDVRYDYMRLLSEQVIEQFYKPFSAMSRQEGAFSRVQCLASPTDVMEAYAWIDVPESETMLNDPDYSRLVSSAAALANKPTVSSESFTCLYGFPNIYHRQEQVADLKLVADAQFANGINQIFYHGMPYNPEGTDTVNFFATVHVGKNAALAPDLADFNSYLQEVSDIMKRGRTYSEAAVYAPLEDGIMAGPYPDSLRRVWVWGQYEMRYIDPPRELEGYHPLWINRYFLSQSEFRNGRLRCGDQEFRFLYLDVDYLDLESLRHILRLARDGLPVVLKGIPLQPGKIKSPEYALMLAGLKALPNTTSALNPDWQPLLSSDDRLPPFWARLDGTALYLFIASPMARDLAYPLSCGQSFAEDTLKQAFRVNLPDFQLEIETEMAPYASLMLKFDMGTPGMTNLSSEYTPSVPVQRPAEPQRMNF